MVKAHSDQHWQLSEVQWGFALFLAAGTWATPFFAQYIDKYGPRYFMMASGLLCAIGWGALGQTSNLISFYAFFCLAGIGVAAVYACGVSTAVKWFPDKRGIASGIITAGYGGGAFLFNPVFDYLIQSIGHSETFIWTGVTHGALIALSGLVLVNPPATYKFAAPAVKANVRRHDLQFTASEMLRTPQFYFLFVAMLSVAIGGLMVTASVKPVATDFGIGHTALTVALVLYPLGNAASRILWGSVSDSLGREKTMFVAFLLQAIFLLALTTLGRQGDYIWVALVVLVFLTWGELYALFPTVLADLYGSKNSAGNYAFLYSAKGFAALLGGGLATNLFEVTGTWDYPFFVCAALALLSAFMALYVRRMPLPQKSPLAVAEGKRTPPLPAE
jgi:OFA family oxalate/formate antiporter-like MFS transporter